MRPLGSLGKNWVCKSPESSWGHLGTFVHFPECVGIIRHQQESREDTSKYVTEVALVSVQAVEQVFSEKNVLWSDRLGMCVI